MTHAREGTQKGHAAAAGGRDVDEYGVPTVLFGPPPDWFYPAVGRVVAVCALLENKAQVLTEALNGAPQDTMTMVRVSDLKKDAVCAARGIDAATAVRGEDLEPLTPAVTQFFDRTEEVLSRRHAIVHAVWPAQPGAEQFGWRPGRRQDGGQTRVTADKTRADLTDLIMQASELILNWPNLHGAASHARQRPLGP